MTAIGLKILTIFSQSFNNERLMKAKRLPERYIYILSRLYDWENPEEDVERKLASELKITTERVRQIGVKALRKLRNKRDFDLVSAIKSIITGYATSSEKDNLPKTIVRLCFFEMDELPTIKMVRLLVCLCCQTKNLGQVMDYCKSERAALLQQYKAGQKVAKAAKATAFKSDRFNKFLDKYVVWFDQVSLREKEEFQSELPKRTVKSDPRYHSGVFNSVKTGKPVQYESGVELRFIKKLESADAVACYFEQPVTFRFLKNKKLHYYTPNFAVLLTDGRCFIAETKGNFHDMMDARLHRGMEQLIDFCKANGFGLLLDCHSHSFDYLFNYRVNTDLEKIIGDKLNENGGRTIFLKELQEILGLTGATKTAVLALALRNNWGYYPFPFKLTPANPYGLFRQVLIDRFAR